MTTHLELLTPQTLRAFVAVARAGNVSRAAQQLCLSQPAVSQQLKSLAEQTGLLLFTRTPHGLALSPDGAALLPQAEKALAGLADFAQAAMRLHGTVRGTLRIGTVLDPAFTRLGAFLKALVEAAPQIQTELRQGMSGDVLAQLARSELDVGFYIGLPDEFVPYRPEAQAFIAPAAMTFEVKPLMHFNYLVVAPPGWGPQVQGRDWTALAALPWLATPPASAHSRMLAAVFGPGSLTGLTPSRVALVDQEASMLDLVRSGVGLSLARDTIALAERQTHGLVVADQVSLGCVLSFICLKSRAQDAVVLSALNALAGVWRQ